MATVAASAARAGGALCVGSKPGCYASLQAAVNAAHDGDTITIAPGTYAGGVMIDVSTTIVGAGAGSTFIKGGGPVLSIGQEQGVTEPTVAISGVTITGGINDSFPGHAVAQGGGVRIPQGAFHGQVPGLGATVTITDSIVTDNKVAAEQLLPPGFCGPFDCSFASGGGIFDDGTLTLIRTRVTDNQAGDPASITVGANGAGIEEGFQATLIVKNSVVSDNRAVGSPPWGDVTGGAGIDASGRLEITDTTVSNNKAELSTDDPTAEFPVAVAGGVGIGGQATISRTRVTDNAVTAFNIGGQALAVAGGILDEGSLNLTNTSIDRNHVSSSIPAASTDTALAGAGGIEVDGAATIRDAQFVGNAVVASAPAGSVGGGGGGLSNFGQTTVERTLFTGNSVTMNGATGSAHGGGIYNDTLFGSTPSLTVSDSAITANNVVSSTGVTRQGGGLFTAFPIALTTTTIAGNQPDQCNGC
jgi:hypothetical protein